MHIMRDSPGTEITDVGGKFLEGIGVEGEGQVVVVKFLFVP